MVFLSQNHDAMFGSNHMLLTLHDSFVRLFVFYDFPLPLSVYTNLLFFFFN